MLCSAAELELSDEHDGIIELPEDAPVGALYAQWAGLDDPVIEINLTPNRSDAAGIYGIARDLAAAGLGVLKTPADRADRAASPIRQRHARFRRGTNISRRSSRCASCAA